MSVRRSSQLLALALAVLVAPVGAGAQENLGINTHVPSDDLLDMCADLGVSWIRVDGNWLDMHPGPARFDFATMDRVVNGARTRGLRVFMTLGYTPAWVPRVPRSRTDGYEGNDEPATSAEWVAFVTAAVTHFRPLGVTHFGLWNEPNLGGFWESAAGTDPWIDKILVPGAVAVRRACADCRVLGPELAHVGDYDRFLDRVLARAASSIDILTHHIYQGFPETGSSGFTGDNFFQAMDFRRFPFTRAALREVLDARRFTGEVWISETGHRARPPGDAAQENTQATYVRRVMEEQLARPWWSNSFFYEIMDCGVDAPSCDIDGYGITRPRRALTAGGARRFPEDYRLKPAYAAIRAFVRAHPEIVARGRPPQCANGTDDDRDGYIDGNDRGCASGLDDNEADDPPRRRIEALPAPAGGVRADGDLREWGPEGWVALRPEDWVGVVPYGGAADLGARIAARWSEGVLYLAVEVTDERHVNDRPDDSLWAGDAVQLGFDVARNYGTAYDATDDHELNLALARGAPRSFRFHGPAGAAPAAAVAVARDGVRTVYEVALVAATLRPATLRAGTVLGFSFLVNDNDGASTTDGSGREGWLEFTPGIGARKVPYRFGELALVNAPPDAGITDAAAPLDTPAPVDAPPPRDVATDAGTDALASDLGARPDTLADASQPPGTDAARDDTPAPATDAGSAPRTAPPGGGCSCHAARTGGGGAAVGLVLVLGVLARRRLRRDPC